MLFMWNNIPATMKMDGDAGQILPSRRPSQSKILRSHICSMYIVYVVRTPGLLQSCRLAVVFFFFFSYTIARDCPGACHQRSVNKFSSFLPFEFRSFFFSQACLLACLLFFLKKRVAMKMMFANSLSEYSGFLVIIVASVRNALLRKIRVRNFTKIIIIFCFESHYTLSSGSSGN